MDCSPPEVPENMTAIKELYEDVYHILYGFGLPTICVAGFLGNVLNLCILAGRQVQHSLRRNEQSANTGLVALAVADLFFCITAFPCTFLPTDYRFTHKGFLLYYGMYSVAVISTFIMTSTWITVTMSTERYLAICHPLRSRKIISVKRTKIAIIVVYIMSSLFNIPSLWRYGIQPEICANRTIYTLRVQILFGSEQLDHAYRACWSAFGNLLPLLLLLVFNVALMREIKRSYAMRRQMHQMPGRNVRNTHSSDSESSYRITITLVAIVTMFFIFVAPSELMKQLAFLMGSDLDNNYTYLTIEVITNVMQTINFSANFILYCIINPSFRRSMKAMFCFHYKKVKSNGMNGSFADLHSRDRYSSMRMSQLRSATCSKNRHVSDIENRHGSFG